MAFFYADENVSSLLNDAIRLHGHAVVTTHDEGRAGATDGSQLLYAANRGWIIVTHNRADFTMLHDAWHLWARAWDVKPEHAGIIILEPVQPSRYAEVAVLIHDVCQQNALTNTLFAQIRSSRGDARRAGNVIPAARNGTGEQLCSGFSQS